MATPFGYVVEAVVRPSEVGLASFVAGQRIGLDLAVNIARASGDGYIGQYFLHIASSDRAWPYENAAALCTPQLAE